MNMTPTIVHKNPWQIFSLFYIPFVTRIQNTEYLIVLIIASNTIVLNLFEGIDCSKYLLLFRRCARARGMFLNDFFSRFLFFFHIRRRLSC